MTRRHNSPHRPAPYITAEGLERLQEEVKALWARRAGVTEALSAAAAEGDRSENAEYIYRKKELRGIDRRLGYLQRRLPSLNVAGKPPKTDQVYFGAWVTLEDEAGRETRYRIVGPDEFDERAEYISVDSPLARGLLGRQVDDEISVDAAGGRLTYFIVEIRYT